MATSFDNPANKGTYWRGADNNVYVAGSQGVNAAGVWDANTSDYWQKQGYSMSADPNPGNKSAAPNIGSIYGGGGGGAPKPVYAPKLDVASLSAKARAAAESAVNPYYTKLLGDFLTQQAFQRTQQQKQYETNVENMDKQLQNRLEGNDITRDRTAEDTAMNIAQVNQTADEFQTDSGQAFDESRMELARTASTGGLGRQKVNKAQNIRNTEEGRQVAKFQEAKVQQEQFKSRSFDDLARSDKLGKEDNEAGKKQAKFDLDDYIQNSIFGEQNKRNELEQGRLEAVGRESGNQSKLLFNQYLAGISNPAQYQAAVQTYGGIF